ncbi:MAG TPA: hypothetical protein VE777_20400 [Gaiellales bacterium]|nr:hypothetical protein [Gaiellales bacterium]
MASAYLPTLYKARRVPTKSPCCAICIDRTRGRTREVRLTHGVAIWLCEPHASHQFQTQRSGRDFVRTLSGVWQANGCLTAARHRALRAHLSRLTERPVRPRPGSYAWPELRRRLERRYAEGASPAQLASVVHERYATCPARPPSRRTLERWHAERRWVTDRPP